MRIPNDRIGRTVLVLALAVVPLTTMLATDGLVSTPASDPGSALAAAGPATKPSKARGPTASDAASTIGSMGPSLGPAGGSEPTPGGPVAPPGAPTVHSTAVPAFTVSPTWFATSAPTNPPAAKPKPTPRPTATPRPTPSPGPTPGPTQSPAPCTVFPSNNVWNRDISALPVRADSTTLVDVDRADRVSASRLQRDRRLRNPDQQGRTCRRRATASPSSTRDESDPGPYPIPAEPEDRGRQRPRTCSSWDTAGCRLYEIFDAVASRRPLDRRLGRDLGPALERAAAGRLDERRRRRPADPARPRPLRRGRGAARSGTPSASRRPTPATGVHLPGPPRGRRRRRRRRCRRWACASA